MRKSPTIDLGARQRHLILSVTLTLLFALGVYASWRLRTAAGGVSSMAFGVGFIVGAWLVLPKRYALACALAGYVASVVIPIMFGRAIWPALALGAVQSGESIVLAWLIQRQNLVRLTTSGRVLKVLFLAIVPGITLSTIAHGLMTQVMGDPSSVSSFLTRLTAKILSAWIFLPATMIYLVRSNSPNPIVRRWEAAGLVTLVLALCLLQFADAGGLALFALFPAVTLLALRLGPRAVSAVLIAGSVIIFPAVIILSPGRFIGFQVPIATQVMLLQVAFSSLMLCGLTVALISTHQRRLASLVARKSEAATRARDRAWAASMAKTDFLATMSHEIRTPLNSIVGFSQLLSKRTDLPAEAHRQIGLVQRSGEALLVVVDDILDFSRVEAGQLALDPRPASPLMVIEDALQIVAASAAAKGLELRLLTEGDVAQPYLVDENRLRQVLLNLLSNAIKFTAEGSVTVRIAILRGEERDRVEISVADTGPGIPQEAQSKLFQRFSQVDGTIRRGFGGSGLGLAISKALVEMMNGRIGVESAPGEGSIFWLEIDLEPAVESPGQAIDPPGEAHAGRLLVVDDHPVNRELAVAMLEILGYVADVAAGGAEAVEMVKVGGYDVILMDVHMPEIDGLEATRLIRALPARAGRTPIIAMSADVLPEQVERCLKSGMVDSVAKPLDVTLLHRCLERWIGRDAEPDPIAPLVAGAR